MAITWRSINQPVTAGVGLLMNGAQQGLNNGFNALQNVLDQRNKTEAANWQQQKSNNTSDYLNQVQALNTPEALADPTAQANLAALRQQFGYQVDANAIRGADEKRATDLQVQASNNAKFSDMNLERDQRPLVEQFYGLKNAGDFKGAQALLDANPFLKEGELADSLKTGEYRQSGEQRAIAADGRAAQSNALNMQVGRANLNWTNEQRAQLKDTQSRAKAGDALLGQTISQFNASRGEAAQKTNALAESFGVKIVDGVPDLTDVPPEVQEKLGAAAKEQGLDLIESPTAARKRLEADLRANQFPESEIAGHLKTFENAITTTNGLSAGDQADVDAQKAALKTAVDLGIEKQTKDFATKTRKNIFLQGVEDPNLTTEDVAKGLKGNEFDPMFFEGWNRDQVIDSTTNIMTKGIEVDGKHYDVPPPLLKAAMAMGANDWFDPRQGIEDSLKSFIRSNPEAYADSIGALDEHKKELRNINEAGIKRAARIDAQTRAANNIPYDVSKFTKTLLKERN